MRIPSDPLARPLPDIPVAIEPIIGWRGLTFGEQAEERPAQPRIYDSVSKFKSPSLGDLWPAGRLSWDMDCRCHAPGQAQQLVITEYFGGVPCYHTNLEYQRIDQLTAELAPELCRCGINAFARRGRLLGTEYGSCPMIAQVALWGQVRKFERGYRAEHSQILRVWSAREASRDRVVELCEREGIEYAGHLRWWRAAHLPLLPFR
jgi:hypothetical protein